MNRPAEIMTFLGAPAIVSSERMRQLLDLVRRVAQSNAAVLVTGESGSGKEVVARALHHYSLRSSKPWVDISCAALPDHLLESELFGYEKGAFSGADSAKPGLFELANGGTLYLDEIGELDPKMQVKLLRVLDNVPYYRLGGVRKVSVDVRIVAATNRDLEAAIRAGGFRGDLYHRLNQVNVQVPPVRERLDDIVPLAEFFLAQQNRGLTISEPARQALRRHDWPGNVREVRNVITRAALLANGPVLEPGDFPQLSRAQVSAPAHHAEDLDSMERRMILSMLQQTGGHYQKAAERLGISRKTLSRKLKSYGVTPVSVAS